MPKGPKFKRGFTWQHYFDEWWDRRPHEWKIRLFIWVGIAVVFGGVGGFLWMNRWMAREEIVMEAKKIHQRRIEGADKLFFPQANNGASPELRGDAEVEIRSED